MTNTIRIALVIAFLVTSSSVWSGALTKPETLFDEPLSLKEITFVNRGTTLSGTIVMPGSAPVAGAVVVHGSGPSERALRLGQIFASRGIATLVYDKRGVGKSEGLYVGPEGNASETNLNLLAEDAAAALGLLAAHPSMTKKPVGFVGLSQAGWIIPLAANKTPAAQFMALISGPVCTVHEEGIYSKFTGDGDAVASVADFAIIRQAMAKEYVWPEGWGKDTDPVESLSSLSIPGLWVFGEKDASMPVDLSISRLEGLISAGKYAYEYRVMENVGHVSVLTRETFTLVADWIRDTAGRAKKI